MAGTYRHGRVYCQRSGCRRRVDRAVDVEIPLDWSATHGFRTVTVTIGACREDGRLLDRLLGQLLEARVEHFDLLTVIAHAMTEDARLRAEVERLENDLAFGEGALSYVRDRTERAEADLVEAEGAIAYQRERADRAEAGLRRRRLSFAELPADQQAALRTVHSELSSATAEARFRGGESA